jgi:hypothetical protein
MSHCNHNYGNYRSGQLIANTVLQWAYNLQRLNCPRTLAYPPAIEV